MTYSLRAGLAVALLVAAGSTAAEATRDGTIVVAQQRQTTPKKPAQGRPTADKDKPQAGDGQVRRRLDQIEEQLVDMQVVIGTLESLAKSGGAPARGPASQPIMRGDSARVESLEIQIKALTAQIERLAEQMRAMQAGRGVPEPDRRGALEPVRPDRRQAAAPPPAGPPPKGFGDIEIKRGQDPIGRIIRDGDGQPQPSPVAVQPTGSPQEAYQAAYNFLLQYDYGAAEAAFQDFLSRYPKDRLAGNAQYWLGETYFIRGKYRQAAGAFFKGYQDYAAGPKAPDSLLKLAISLHRLGQKGESCATFDELGRKFPAMPQDLRHRASVERRKVGC
ncbi:MAG: tol-pal system protein YbgF [Hyphomicrobiaceae bacterium]|nr:tol-pal system protein YbgF [Hyphomicrobiaceae bacterium]